MKVKCLSEFFHPNDKQARSRKGAVHHQHHAKHHVFRVWNPGSIADYQLQATFGLVADAFLPYFPTRSRSLVNSRRGFIQNPQHYSLRPEIVSRHPMSVYNAVSLWNCVVLERRSLSQCWPLSVTEE